MFTEDTAAKLSPKMLPYAVATRIDFLVRGSDVRLLADRQKNLVRGNLEKMNIHNYYSGPAKMQFYIFCGIAC